MGALPSRRIGEDLEMLELFSTDQSGTPPTWNSPESVGPTHPLLLCVLRQLGRPVLVLSSDGTLIYTNDCGKEFLGADLLMRVVDGRVVASNPSCQKSWRQCLEKCRAGLRHLIFLGSGVSGRAICTCPVAGMRGEGPLVLALVGGAANSPGYPLAELGRHFRFTTTEILVLEQLLANRKPIDIARESHRSVSTIRAHVRSLLAKTESASMSDLLLSVSRLPPVHAKSSQLMGSPARHIGTSEQPHGESITTLPAKAWQ